MKGLKFLITLFVGASLSPLTAHAQYSEMAARDNASAQQRALVSRLEQQETRLIALEKELYALRAQVVAQARNTAPATNPDAPARVTMPAAPAQQTVLSGSSLNSYTVRTGDTLNSIARDHKVSVMELMAINNLHAPDRIQIGSELLIPTLNSTPAAPGTPPVAPATAAVPTAPTAPAANKTYTVRSGDTIAGIAKAHGLSIQDIATANGMANPNILAVDQKLIIPSAAPAPAPVAPPKVLAKTSVPAAPEPIPSPAPAPATPEPTADNPFPSGYAYYTVVAGDNLYTLAKLFGTSQKELEELNGMGANATIHPDQQIVVPIANYKGPFVQASN